MKAMVPGFAPLAADPPSLPFQVPDPAVVHGDINISIGIGTMAHAETHQAGLLL